MGQQSLCSSNVMSLLPYTSPYYAGAYPHGAYGHHGAYGYPGAYPYGPYGMTAEEIQKVREAEEKAFNDAEAKRKEFMEAEKKKYEEFVAAEKIGPYAYGPYGPSGPFGHGYGYGHPGAFGRYGYGYPGAGYAGGRYPFY